MRAHDPAASKPRGYGSAFFTMGEKGRMVKVAGKRKPPAPCAMHETDGKTSGAASCGHEAKGQSYLELPILQMVVPQTGQVPLVIGRPFLVVVCLGSVISCFFLHFMQ